MSHPVESWWQAFEEKAASLDALFRGNEEWDLPAWMHEHLGAIDPRLMWEFGPGVNGEGHRLVITPEAERSLRPLVRATLARAPDLPGWEFYGYRLPEDLDTALATISARADIDFETSTCQIGFDDMRFINLRFIVPDCDEDDEDQLHAAFVASETLLGEEMLDRWIGAVTISPIEDSELPGAVSLGALASAVDAVREELLASLPDQPWHQRDLEEGWASVELKPEPADDYAEQYDLIALITPAFDVLENVLSGRPFDSVRHSRHGERYCYLKIDGRSGLDATPWDDRGDITDALDAVLRDACLGSTIGGGTGLMYSYIELALTDVARAWAAIRTLLREGNLDERTWLLFHDTDEARVYRGLYDHTPPPPNDEE